MLQVRTCTVTVPLKLLGVLQRAQNISATRYPTLAQSSNDPRVEGVRIAVSLEEVIFGESHFEKVIRV